jgi:hypothetical protein
MGVPAKEVLLCTINEMGVNMHEPSRIFTASAKTMQAQQINEVIIVMWYHYRRVLTPIEMSDSTYYLIIGSFHQGSSIH